MDDATDFLHDGIDPDPRSIVGVRVAQANAVDLLAKQFQVGVLDPASGAAVSFG